MNLTRRSGTSLWLNIYELSALLFLPVLSSGFPLLSFRIPADCISFPIMVDLAIIKGKRIEFVTMRSVNSQLQWDDIFIDDHVTRPALHFSWSSGVVASPIPSIRITTGIETLGNYLFPSQKTHYSIFFWEISLFVIVVCWPDQHTVIFSD